MRIETSRFSPAESLLWRHGVTAPEHIDLDGLAAAEGAEVRYRSLEGCEARLLVVGDRGVISVKSYWKNLGRQRFSLAHELAHWMRDRNVGGLLCASDDISPSNIAARSRESEANSYASQLVLPDYLVAPRAEEIALTIDGAQQLSSDFHTSLTAAAIKLVRLSSIPSSVICHRPGGTCWFQKGRVFPPDVYIRKEIHHDSPAFRLLYGEEGGRTPVRKEPAARWLSGASVWNKELCCQSMKLPDGTVLSILSM